MTSDLKPSDVLSKAADLIEPEGAWIQREAVTSKSGSPCGYDEGQCFCVFGAVRKQASEPEQFEQPWRYLERVLLDQRGPINWNDDPDRTQAEVVTALRKAAELARSEGQ